jgi:glucose-1-phosphate adenylyltransferase
VYNFVDENKRPKYWRDIGTRDAYYQANMDLLERNSEFDLFNRSWPVRTYHEQYPPIKIINTRSGSGSLVDSMIAGGCVIEGGLVEKSILSSNVKIYEKAEVKNSIIMEGVTVGKNAKIRNAIIDKEVTIPPGMTIGYDSKLDRKRFVLTTSGITIVPKKSSISI